MFEKKLTIFQDFLEKLCDVISDGKITKEEAIQMEFATSYIAMHMKSSEEVKIVINNVKKIIDNLGLKKQGSEGDESTPNALFNIVSVFKKDLYDTPYDKKDLPHIEESVKAFEDIVKAIDGQVESIVDDTLDLADDYSVAIANFKKIADTILSSIGNEWKAEIIKDNHLSLALDKGDRNKLAFFLCCEPEYYFQLHIDVPEREYVDVYDPFKWKFGGRRNKYSWWQYIKQEYRGNESFLQSLEGNDRAFNDYLVSSIVSRIKYFEEFWSLYSTVEIPLAKDTGSYRGWKLQPAFWYRCIAFDKDDEMKTYFDVRLEENSTYSIHLHNRRNNEEALKLLVAKIGDVFSPVTNSMDSHVKHLVCSNVSPLNVVDEVNKLIDKIN